MGKKRGKKDDSMLTPEEKQRRERQNQLRELAMKLRAEGKEYKHHHKLQQPEKRKADDSSHGDKKDKRAKHEAKAYLGDKQPTWRPFNDIDVVVIPIFWNHNKDEKFRVMKAAEHVKDMLVDAGVKVDMDASNKYTPGQKMKYWETMGVKVRIELGPRDAENGRCVIAVAKGVGEVADKTTVKVNDDLQEAVTSALSKARSAAAAEEEHEEPGKKQKKAKKEDADSDDEGGNDQDDEDEDEAGSSGEDDADEDDEEEEEEEEAGGSGDEGSEEQQEGAAAGQKQPRFISADAEEDDFGELAYEAEEDKLLLSKDELLKKQRKIAKLQTKKSLGGGGGDDAEGYMAQKKAKKVKTVVF